MDSLLDGIGIDELESIARASRYHASEMALGIGLTVRQLERSFLKRFNLTPRVWLGMLLANDAQTLLRKGEPVKLVATKMGFSDDNNFRRAFHRFVGRSPATSNPQTMSHLGHDSVQMSQNDHSFALNLCPEVNRRDTAQKVIRPGLGRAGPKRERNADMIAPPERLEASLPSEARLAVSLNRSLNLEIGQ